MRDDRDKTPRQKKGIWWTVALLALLALGFYFGFMLMMANGGY